jgi:hypothetical protein
VRDAAFRDIGRDALVAGLLGAFRESTVRVERSAFRGTSTQAFTLDSGSRLELEDVVSTELTGRPESGRELGVTAFGGSSVLLSRVLFSGVALLAIGAGDDGTSLDARDVVVRDMRAGVDIPTGYAVEGGGGARLTFERLLIERAVAAAVVASDPGTVLVLDDVTVRGTAAGPAGAYGRALQLQTGATVTGARIAVADNREVSIVAARPGTHGVLTDVSIERTAVRDCATAGCPGAGIGAGAYEGSHLEVERFVARDNALCGVQVARDGAIDLRSGEVSGNPIGANVQVPGYDVARLSNGVIYRDNDRDFDGEAQPVPDPTTPSGM